MTSEVKYDVGVIGAGAWGTTLASLLASNGHYPLLWAYEDFVSREINESHRNTPYLPSIELPENLESTSDPQSFKSITRIIIAVPSAFYAPTVQIFSPVLRPDAIVVSATKGFIDSRLTRPSDYLGSILKQNRIGVLSGPNLSREIASGLPAISLVASEDMELVSEFQKLLSSGKFRVYGGTDMIGTELGGSLKNIMAIAAGLVDGLNLGENTLAALITRGLAEMIRLGRHFNAQDRTFYGVSGLGDLVCTSQSRLSRNQEVGRLTASGMALDEILGRSKAVAEGVGTTKHVHEYAAANKIELPITSAVHAVLFEKVDPGSALRELMTRTLKME